jgi:hypothetical protein
MSESMQKELRRTRQSVADCLRKYNPTRQFRATLVLAMIGMHLVASRIDKTKNPKERRLLVDEFNQSRNAITNGLQLLKRSRNRASFDQRTRATGPLP